MSFTYNTTTTHHGAELHEKWKFPDPRDRGSGVTLEIWTKESGGFVISKSEVPLKEVPERAARPFVEDAEALYENLGEMIEITYPE